MSIIKVENLSKKYIIGHDKAANRAYHYYSLRESLMHHTRGVYQRLRHPLTPNRENTELEEFWALKDINFEIEQGDRVGIIGRNGAGKSTLLKILSRITEPSTGKINMKGRVASLLEVGTGFHPELTGRENIYLNGAILGMTRVEIKKKFDEIVAFAEIEKFLDTPVKRYSSGMYVRLAFAVAAHLEPEILLVDEVLAVGDAEFQKKCLGKMEDVSKEGRTVLFVSHNMGAIRQLCSTVIFLDNGRIYSHSNKLDELIYLYYGKQINHSTKLKWEADKDGLDVGNQYFKPISIYLQDNSNNTLPSIFSRDMSISIEINFIIETFSPLLEVGFTLYDANNNIIFVSQQTDKCVEDWPELKVGNNKLTCTISKYFLTEGLYHIEVYSCLYMHEWICEPGKNSPTLSFEILGNTSQSPYWKKKRPGYIAPILEWST